MKPCIFLLTILFLNIPLYLSCSQFHKIKPGDTFWKLSITYGISVDELITLNPNSDYLSLQIGELICVKKRSASSINNERISNQYNHIPQYSNNFSQNLFSNNQRNFYQNRYNIKNESNLINNKKLTISNRTSNGTYDLPNSLTNLEELEIENTNFEIIDLKNLTKKIKKITIINNPNLFIVLFPGFSIKLNSLMIYNNPKLIEIDLENIESEEYKFEENNEPSQKEEEETCSICYNSLERNPIKLGCNHVFHNNCIKKWVNECEKKHKISTCPMCRKQIDKRNLK